MRRTTKNLCLLALAAPLFATGCDLNDVVVDIIVPGGTVIEVFDDHDDYYYDDDYEVFDDHDDDYYYDDYDDDYYYDDHDDGFFFDFYGLSGRNSVGRPPSALLCLARETET